MTFIRKGKFHVYIVRCANGTYYTGSTNNLQKRIKRHNSGHGAKYLRGKLPVVPVYAKEYKYYKLAILAERKIKTLTRKEKEALIASYQQRKGAGGRKMKNKTILCFIFMLLVPAVVSLAEDEAVSKIPQGMEEIQITGSAKLIVPKGAKTKKVGAQIIVEGTKEYMSRRFSEMDDQLKQIEKKIADLQSKLNTLSNTAAQKQKDINNPPTTKKEEEL